MTILNLKCTSILVLLFVTIQVMHAQKKDSPQNKSNALNYRFPSVDRKLPNFEKGYPFGSRIYTLFGLGVQSLWANYGNVRHNPSLTTRLSVGYHFSPIHAVEFSFLYGESSVNSAVLDNVDYYGADINYVMNLMNFAYRRDRKNNFEVLLSAGGSYRYQKGHYIGINTGFRLQYNLIRNIGLFIDPRLDIVGTRSNDLSFATVPSVSLGFSFGFHSSEPSFYDYLPPFALRTNLLYDAAAVPNIGLEFYLGRGWSIGANWMYTWWSNNSRHRYWRTYGGELYTRRYFGQLAKSAPLSGHHVGVYLQGLTYDMEWGDKGYLSKFSYGAGLEYGYSLPVGRRINIDFTLGLGYLGGKFKTYQSQEDCYVWQSTNNRHWIGPTKAEISFVWLLGNRPIREKKGGKQ